MSEMQKNNAEVTPENTKDGEETVNTSRVVYDLLGTVFTAIILLLIIMTFFVRQVTVSGSSMQDTLQDNDRLLVSCFNYKPQNGDIVVVTHGKNLDEPIIKRVIATEGQRLSINYEEGEVVVDGVLLNEDYIKGNTIAVPNSSIIPDVIPEGYVFVMGDNREHSLDSRSSRVDLIPVENIIGKAFVRIFPIGNFKFI